MATATRESLPTADQLREYAAELPEIYRNILNAFPTLEPNRRVGQHVLIGQIESLLSEKSITPEEITFALKNLKDDGFVEYVKDFIAVKPSRTGEALITAITGKKPRIVKVPELPKKKW